MKKVEGIFYSFKKKENMDLSEVDVVRFNVNDEQYIDVRIKDGIISVMGSQAIKITMTAGSNAINVGIEE
jgi:hypothetical protein